MPKKKNALLTSCWWDTVLMRQSQDCRKWWWFCLNFHFRGRHNLICESSHQKSVGFRQFWCRLCQWCILLTRSVLSYCASGGSGFAAADSSMMFATEIQPVQLTLEWLNLYGHYGKVWMNLYINFFQGNPQKLIGINI